MIKYKRRLKYSNSTKSHENIYNKKSIFPDINKASHNIENVTSEANRNKKYDLISKKSIIPKSSIVINLKFNDKLLKNNNKIISPKNHFTTEKIKEKPDNIKINEKFEEIKGRTNIIDFNFNELSPEKTDIIKSLENNRLKRFKKIKNKVTKI
jgi:hypothetical protein